MDRKANLNKRPMERSNKNLDALIKTIYSFGVTLNVWEKVDGDGKGGNFDFTSLMGADKRLLLKALPSKLPAILPKETSETIAKLRQVSFLSKISPKKDWSEVFVYISVYVCVYNLNCSILC